MEARGFQPATREGQAGPAGVDGQEFPDIEGYGPERWLGELVEKLKMKTYRSQAVRRGYITKDNGEQRPLGIPTITDRVVQMSVLQILGPIFEADLQPEQYGYRPKHRAQDAVKAVHALLNTGHTEVVDADLCRDQRDDVTTLVVEGCP